MRRVGPGLAAWTGAASLLLATVPAAAAVDCTASASGVAYASYNPLLPTPTDSTGTVTVACTFSGTGSAKINYTLALSQGLGNSFATRRMSYATAQLGYNLFTDVARSQVWGDGTAGTSLVSGSFVLNSGRPTQRATHTVYGRVTAQQDVLPGAYGDFIVVTLIF